MIFYVLTKLFVTTKESLQTTRDRVRSISHTQKLNLITIFQSKLVITNSRRSKSNNSKFFFRHSQIDKSFPQKSSSSATQTMTCQNQMTIASFMNLFKNAFKLAFSIHYRRTQHRIYISIEAFVNRRLLFFRSSFGNSFHFFQSSTTISCMGSL